MALGPVVLYVSFTRRDLHLCAPACTETNSSALAMHASVQKPTTQGYRDMGMIAIYVY